VDRAVNGESINETSTVRGARLGEDVGAEPLSLLQLKLAIAREEKEKINAEKEKAESAWLIEKAEIGDGAGVQRRNGPT